MLGRGDKVNYLGSEMVIGMSVLQEPITQEFPPIQDTYIWQAFLFDNDNVYVIQHKEGMDAMWFAQLALQMSPLDLDKIKSDKKYILVMDDEIELVQRYGEEPLPEPIPASNLKGATAGNSEEEAKEAPVEAPEAEQPAQEATEPQSYHFTEANPVTTPFVEMARKPSVLKVTQVKYDFTVEAKDGTTKHGKADDYIAIRGEHDMMPVTKHIIESAYEDLNKRKTVELSGLTYVVVESVWDYIQWLQDENDRLRSELYLKNPQVVEPQGSTEEVPAPEKEKAHTAVGDENLGSPLERMQTDTQPKVEPKSMPKPKAEPKYDPAGQAQQPTPQA